MLAVRIVRLYFPVIDVYRRLTFLLNLAVCLRKVRKEDSKLLLPPITANCLPPPEILSAFSVRYPFEHASVR